MASSSSAKKIRRSRSTRTEYLENKGSFLTAHIIGKPYGEMNPKFIKEIYGELEGKITVFDKFNRQMIVQFNGSTQHPLIVHGWNKMRNFFEITGNGMILMTYVGNCSFMMHILPQEFNPSHLPSYHTYRTFHTDLSSFDVKLTHYSTRASQLTMRKDFAAYIQNSGYKNLVLYGPSGDEVGCTLILREKYTKISEGWMPFIHKNGFRAGDVLNFKFVNKEENNVMKVIKL